MPAGGEAPTRTREVRQDSARPEGTRERIVALYEAHRDGIYRFLVGHGLSPAEAQEVTQDIFVDLFVAMERGTAVNSERGWLYAVAGRAAVDHWRRKSRVTQVELDLTNATQELVSSDPSPEAQASKEQRLRRLAAGMSRLPNEQRLCIQLRMKGLRYREIAEVLGVSTSTAAEWVDSAIDRLRGESR